MKRYFNTEGICDPTLHYMVNLHSRIEKTRRLLIDKGKYFVINRGRQYGKTTMLHTLADALKEDYFVISMDFQRLSSANFKDEPAFCRAFVKMLLATVRDLPFENKEALLLPLTDLGYSSTEASLDELFLRLSDLCKNASRPVVMLIDEIDSASDNQVFLDFLSMLRGYYLNRNSHAIFHSVILAGVYDIKNLKLKLRPGKQHKYNRPWNIAAKFQIDMNFSTDEIAAMLQEYEADHHTGMDLPTAAKQISHYTCGYPYLVSAVCRLLDEDLPQHEQWGSGSCVWTAEGITAAVHLLLKENTPLFDSIAKQLDMYPDLKEITELILYQGKQIPFSPMVVSIQLGMMFGFLKEENGCAVIANRIFEMAMLQMFLSEESARSESYWYGQRDKNQFLQHGRLRMDLVLEKFVAHFTELYDDKDEAFIEKYGRKFFLLYLKPIINGTGNYYIEAQTRDAKRTDVIVDYRGEQFIIELKIWHGNEYQERGREQLCGYLDYFGLQKGYLLSFQFRKKKKPGIRTIEIDGRTIIEAIV